MTRQNYTPHLSIVLLLVLSFILAVGLSTLQSHPDVQRTSNSITAQLLGDSRRLFANHFYSKADEYFHKGYYPSIFDQAAVADQKTRPAVAMGAVSGDAHEGEVQWMGEPRDWIERFSRHFFPSEHAHLGDAHEDHDHDGDGVPDHAPKDHDDHNHDHAAEQTGAADDVSEILPWLSIAAELNPNRPDIYVTGAYYLRDRMDQVDQAEAFLREGWRNNPKSPAILFELARIKEENRHQLDAARNLYRVAMLYWDETESKKEEPDMLLLMQLLMHFARAERAAGNLPAAIPALEHLKTISPSPDAIERLIQEYRADLPLVFEPAQTQ